MRNGNVFSCTYCSTIDIKHIATKVNSNWRYSLTKGNWGCDVCIFQDKNGKVEDVNTQSCNVENKIRLHSFKGSIERAVYKSSQLPN